MKKTLYKIKPVDTSYPSLPWGLDIKTFSKTDHNECYMQKYVWEIQDRVSHIWWRPCSSLYFRTQEHRSRGEEPQKHMSWLMASCCLATLVQGTLISSLHKCNDPPKSSGCVCNHPLPQHCNQRDLFKAQQIMFLFYSKHCSGSHFTKTQGWNPYSGFNLTLTLFPTTLSLAHSAHVPHNAGLLHWLFPLS